MTFRIFALTLIVASTLGACTSQPSGIQTSVEGYIPFDGKLKIN